MLRVAMWTAGLLISTVVAVGFIGLGTATTKVAQPEFVPGQRIIIETGRLRIEATVAEPQAVNRWAKADAEVH